MIITLIFLTIILIIEFRISPRLGFTRENNLLLWYGKKERNYIIIW